MSTDNQRAGCLGPFLKLFGGASKPASTATMPYISRNSLLTNAERSFYGVLKAALNGRYEVFAKVRIADFIGVKKGADSAQSFRNKIMQKHVDFLLCDPGSLAPIAAIELDDASHQRKDRQERDAFVDRVMEAANLPIVHIANQATYDPRKVSDALALAIQQARNEA